jgi:hypothetical protein
MAASQGRAAISAGSLVMDGWKHDGQQVSVLHGSCHHGVAAWKETDLHTLGVAVLAGWIALSARHLLAPYF